MRDLRELLIDKIIEYPFEHSDKKLAEMKADTILALPSGLVAVKECNGIEHRYKNGCCIICGGEWGFGRIERDLSIQEALDILKWIVHSGDPCYFENGISIGTVIMPSGERVEMKR